MHALRLLLALTLLASSLQAHAGHSLTAAEAHNTLSGARALVRAKRPGDAELLLTSLGRALRGATFQAHSDTYR